MNYHSLLLCSLLALLGAADSTFKPVLPPAIPLAVRNPYLSAWLPAGNHGGGDGYLAGKWPAFWNGDIVGWSGMIRVDGTNYVWMGKPNVTSALVVQTAFEYTSTRSTFTMTVGGKVGMTIDFLSPVYADDMKRQSFPVAYMQVSVKSIDGKTHIVQLYTDISAEWISGNSDDIAQWDYGTTGTIAYHHVFRQTQLAFSEAYDQTLYGDWYYATTKDSVTSYQSGAFSDVENQFAKNGLLLNTQDKNYRAIDNRKPVFAYAKNMQNVGSTSKSALFTINLAQKNVIQFEGSSDAVSFFYNDFSNASASGAALDNKISTASIAAAGNNYNVLTSLALRQAFGSLQYAGTTSKPYIFMKEISSDGNVNTVDVIFPFHPLAIYLNPQIIKLLLDPLFENQEAGNWPYKYSIHDIGSSFPNATGHNDGNDEQQPVEECGNMILMTLAYAQQTGDNAYLTQHYPILKQWNTFLVNKSLYPDNQISTDDFAGSLANQTNLAIKGIVGIKAMAQIASRTGHTADAANFNNIASQYLKKWMDIGNNNQAAPPHYTLSYGDANSHGLLYNIYPDKQLSLNFVPQSVFDEQSTFYPTQVKKYGVPLDTRHTYTKSDWQLWCAAVASTSTRDLFISRVAQWTNQTVTYLPYTDLYDTITGDWPLDTSQFTARPVVGGLFSLLALTKAP